MRLRLPFPWVALRGTIRHILTAVVVIGNVLGNTLLSHGMRQVGRVVTLSPLSAGIVVSLAAYARAFVNPWVLFGVGVLVLWMISDLALLSRADLSYVLPVTSVSYVLIALLGRFVLSERVSGHAGWQSWSSAWGRSWWVRPRPAPPRNLRRRNVNETGTRMKPLVVRWGLVGLMAICNSLGDVLNTAGMKRWGEPEDLHPSHFVRMVRAIFHNSLVLAGLGALAVSFLALLALLSIASVSFAVPATAASYLLETLLAKYVLQEAVSWRRWLGVSFVACGVVLLSL